MTVLPFLLHKQLGPARLLSEAMGGDEYEEKRPRRKEGTSAVHTGMMFGDTQNLFCCFSLSFLVLQYPGFGTLNPGFRVPRAEKTQEQIKQRKWFYLSECNW